VLISQYVSQLSPWLSGQGKSVNHATCMSTHAYLYQLELKLRSIASQVQNSFEKKIPSSETANR